MIRRILLLGFLLIFICLPTLPGLAQESITLSTLVISLWPEYDRSSLLVIYKAQIAPEVSLPAEVVFRIPVQAVEPHAVAVGLDVDSVADVAYDVQPAGEWLQVSFIATTPAIRLEYYDPRLQKDGDQRTVSYLWPGDYAVDSLTLEVQHPVGSSDFTVTPPAEDQVQDTYDIVYDLIDKGSVPAGTTFSVDISYQKETDELTSETLPLQPSAPVTAPTSTQLNLDRALPWILGFMGVALIVEAGSGTGNLASNLRHEKSRRRRRSARPKVSEEAAAGEGVYCHNCGKRASASDRFCRACGSKLRIE